MPANRTSPARSPCGKGKSTREKTGCWTCRIRRKKCDEVITPDEYNVHSCKTCRRLRIECLGGFGEKRPKGLKDKVLIKQIKELVKDHLNNNGLVKGIPRPRAPTHGGPDILILSVYLNSVLPFAEAADHGSPVSDTSSSSEDGMPWNLDAQSWPAVEQGCGVLFDAFINTLGAVLPSELASNTLFLDTADYGSPFSDISSSSEESAQWNPALDAQPSHEVEQECSVPSSVFEFDDVMGAVLQLEPELAAPNTLDQWNIYQTHFLR